MATLSFFYSSTYEKPSIDFENVLIIGDSPSSFNALSLSHSVIIAAGLTEESSINLIKTAGSTKLSPGTDSGSSIDLLISQNGNLRKITLIFLSTTYSRHNTPARSHSLASLVKSNKGSSDLLVLLIPSQSSFALAQALTISRQFPLYTLKSSGSKAIKVHVVIHLDSTDETNDNALLQDIIETADSIRLSQRLVDMPPNVLHTDSYVAEIREIASKLGFGLEIIQGQDLEVKGFGGIWGGKFDLDSRLNPLFTNFMIFSG